MTDNVIKTRIKQRIDTAANWANSTELPLKGELIVYEADESVDFSRLKVGDGTNNVNDLPFIYELITADEIDELCGVDLEQTSILGVGVLGQMILGKE